MDGNAYDALAELIRVSHELGLYPDEECSECAKGGHKVEVRSSDDRS